MLKLVDFKKSMLEEVSSCVGGGKHGTFIISSGTYYSHDGGGGPITNSEKGEDSHPLSSFK